MTRLHRIANVPRCQSIPQGCHAGIAAKEVIQEANLRRQVHGAGGAGKADCQPTVKEGVPAADPYKTGDKKHQKALVLKDLDLTTVNHGSIVSSTMESRRVSPTSKVQYKT